MCLYGGTFAVGSGGCDGGANGDGGDGDGGGRDFQWHQYSKVSLYCVEEATTKIYTHNSD